VMNPEGTFGGPTSHSVAEIDQGGTRQHGLLGGGEAEGGLGIVRHRDTECTVNTIMD
jgi:hypothetical protein